MPDGESRKIVRSAPKNVVGLRIKEARRSFKGGLTQDQLSGRLAALEVLIDRAGIAKIELGLRHVYDYELVAFSRALKVDVKWLLDLNDTVSAATKNRRSR